ncbi:hypothetical protein KAR91_31180 [Candidatus Pacearchaeota archaeon]|nr:hypothetical protein [Candidatus Pacearchaeota archaeon]
MKNLLLSAVLLIYFSDLSYAENSVSGIALGCAEHEVCGIIHEFSFPERYAYGVAVFLFEVRCGQYQFVSMTITDFWGEYYFPDLENKWYIVMPELFGYIFFPEVAIVWVKEEISEKNN